MKKVLAFALALSMLLAALPAFAAEEVNVFNWEDYICEDAINLFEAETGIKVNYMRFTTNEDMLVQVENDPKSYDVIFPSDYIIERLIAEDLLEKLDYSQLPNATENTLDWLKTADYDPTGEYSVPYMWGTVGILYNRNMVSAPITSWTAMWDEQYYDNVFMMDSIRDTLGVTLKMLCPERYVVTAVEPHWLGQAVWHLLSNALCACADGGHVTVKLTVQKPNVLLEITDDGCGIPAARQELLFDWLMRPKEPEFLTGGLGVGLPLSYRVAQLHGGQLLLDSREGEGTTATLVLPLRRADSQISDNVFQYTGGFQRSLLELSTALPDTAFLTRHLDE